MSDRPSGPDQHEREALARELRARAGDMDRRPVAGFADVQRTARRIQRRRRVAVGVAAVALAAVVVPTGLTMVSSSTGPVTPVATPGPSQTSSAVDGAVPLTTVGASRGAAPTVGYVEARTYHEMGGGQVHLSASYADLASYGGGLLATQVDGAGQPWVVHLTADGTEVSRERGAARLALSTDGTQLAYVVSGGAAKPDELHSSGVSTMGGGEATQAVPAGVHATPIGYASGGVVYQTDGTSPKVYLTNLSDPPVALPGLLAAGGADENNGVVSGQLTSGDPGSCWVVVKADTGRQVWETCDYALGAFSWDGRYVLGTDAYGDGLGSSGVAILDARTGEVVQRFARPAGSTLFVRDLAWEPSGHALDAIVHEGGSWQILRLGVDGSLEAATDPVSGSDTQSPYVFAATR